MFAVLFDLEGQLDCTLHETKAGADAEAARLSAKYAAERANYSASVAVQAVQLAPAYAEAPAMLAALRASVACLRGFHASPDFGPLDDEAIDAANTILARIDGTPTAQPDDCGAGAAADSFAAHALDTLKDCEAWFANGGDVDGVFFDDATMLDRVRESLALATPTAQPDLAAALADLFERGSWHDDGSFVYWPDDSEPDNEGAIFTLSDIHNRHTT